MFLFSYLFNCSLADYIKLCLIVIKDSKSTKISLPENVSKYFLASTRSSLIRRAITRLFRMKSLFILTLRQYLQKKSKQSSFFSRISSDDAYPIPRDRSSHIEAPHRFGDLIAFNLSDVMRAPVLSLLHSDLAPGGPNLSPRQLQPRRR